MSTLDQLTGLQHGHPFELHTLPFSSLEVGVGTRASWLKLRTTKRQTLASTIEDFQRPNLGFEGGDARPGPSWDITRYARLVSVAAAGFNVVTML